MRRVGAMERANNTDTWEGRDSGDRMCPAAGAQGGGGGGGGGVCVCVLRPFSDSHWLYLQSTSLI